MYESNEVYVYTLSVNIAKSTHYTNTYIVMSKKNKEAILIDPGDEADKIIKSIKEVGAFVKYIILTHTHYDHIGALKAVADYTNAKIMVHINDVDGLNDEEKNYCRKLNMKIDNVDISHVIKIEDGYKFKVDNMYFEVIHTPGHTSGGICIFEKTSNVLFTGDTIFCNCYGRTDLKSASIDDMKKSLDKIFDRFDNILIFPGHDKSVNLNYAKKRIKMLLAIKGE